MKVLVIGGGIVGLTIAREFQRRKDSDVVIIDKGELGNEASFAAAGMLAPQAESNADDAFFRFCVAARDFYVDFAAEIESESEIIIDLDREGTLYAAFDDSDWSELTERYDWQTAAGHEVERLTARETHKLEPFISPASTGALFFPNDWQVENRQLTRALIKSVNRGDTAVYQNIRVKALEFDANSVRGVVTEDGKLFEGDLIVLATGAWTSLIETNRGLFRLPLVKPVRGQMISYHTAKRLLSRVIYSSNGYVVPRSDGRILAGATVEDVGFEDVVTAVGLSDLEQSALEIVPGLVQFSPTDHWSGLRPYAEDGLPVIGKVPECRNLFLSTGHYRNGILLAPYSARILVDSILGISDSKYLEKFSPVRTISAAANG